MFPDTYPGNFLKLILNAVGWKYSYNLEMWFLLPYSILSLCSKWIVQTVKRIGLCKSIAISTSLYIITCYIISRYGAHYLFNNMIIYQPFSVVHLLHPFVIGIAFYQTRINLNNVLPSWAAFFGIIALVVMMGLCRGSAVFGIIYDPLMLFLFCQLSFPQALSRMFMELGRKSMPMWMIHTWLCYYLFKPFFYGLNYPLLIFITLAIVSYVLAISILFAVQILENRKYPKFLNKA